MVQIKDVFNQPLNYLQFNLLRHGKYTHSKELELRLYLKGGIHLAQKIMDYKCNGANASGISEKIITALKLEFPGSYNDAGSMAEIAAAIKNDTGSSICFLPFCHTVEAQALGGIINLSEGKFGPRAAAYAYNSVEELLRLPDFDFNRGRLKEVLMACQMLKSREEKVVLEVSGFFTILNSLIDVTEIFKACRKNARVVGEIFNFLAKNLFRFIEAAKKAGVNIVSYADPAGSVNILSQGKIKALQLN
jgi:uroporphyrinogen-III decarboxylase